VSPASLHLKNGFSWGSVNYAPLVTLGIIAVVTVWYLVSARHTFTGPVNTFNELDGLEPIAPGPSAP
jgi:hypothetical protein